MSNAKINFLQEGFNLPRGVVSKKDIGERRIRISMVLCSKEAALSVKTWQRRVAPMMLSDWRKPSAPYTPRYLFLVGMSVVAIGSPLQAESQMLDPTWKPWKPM